MVRKRRFAQVSTSEDDDDEPKRERRSSTRRKKILRDDGDDDEEDRLEETKKDKSKKSTPKKGGGEKEKGSDDEEEWEEEEEAQASPIGDPVSVSGKGKKRKKHYSSFEHEGNIFELEDPVLLTPASEVEKPYVAIIKDGLTADEKTTKEPDASESMQMTDVRCTICTEKSVAITDIIHAGGHGNRYQLECQACGHAWYASGDAISSLTIDGPNAAGNVGTAPWATAKFEDVERKLVSPRDPEKPVADVFEKSTAAYMPVLETQKSFNRPKADEAAANREY